MTDARAALFREATAEDLPAIVRMLADDPLGATRERPGEPLDPAYLHAFRRIEGNPDDHLVVAEIDGAVKACAQLTVLDGLSHTGMRRAQVEGVRIAADCRGAGLGSALLATLVEWAREADCGVVQLTSNAQRAEAHAFYERLGFRATHVGMKLDLRSAHGRTG